MTNSSRVLGRLVEVVSRWNVFKISMSSWLSCGAPCNPWRKSRRMALSMLCVLKAWSISYLKYFTFNRGYTSFNLVELTWTSMTCSKWCKTCCFSFRLCFAIPLGLLTRDWESIFEVEFGDTKAPGELNDFSFSRCILARLENDKKSTTTCECRQQNWICEARSPST